VFAQVSILAPGLLGASLGLALHERALAQRIHVWARREVSRQQCRASAWCDAAMEDPTEAVHGSELVVICAPVDAIPELLERCLPGLHPEALVTDVGSTKAIICEEAVHRMGGVAHFIGSHPMAGSEKTGMENARPDLFCSRPCLVTPTAETPPGLIDRLVNFWKALQMEVSIVDPTEHDRIVAAISHLPHLLASCLCNHLAGKPPEWADFSGAGLKDTTRVAAGDAELWRAIVADNRIPVLQALREFSGQLNQLEAVIAREEDDALKELLLAARIYREGLS
jgi:cyclohexadieny/prephenate dehydrogenase